MVRHGGSLLAMTLALGLANQVGAQGAGRRGGDDSEPKGKREPPKKVIVSEAETHLDDVQKAALRDAKKMIGKLYGFKDEIPDEGKDHFQKTIWTVFDGTHKPERTKSNKFASFLIEVLTKQSITIDYAVSLLSKTAEIISNPNEAIPQEEIDNFIVEARGILGSSQLTPERQSAEVKAIEQLLMQGIVYNEEKVKQREADAKRKADAKEKAEKEKADKKAKAKGASGQRGGRGGGGNRGGGGGNRGGGGGRG